MDDGGKSMGESPFLAAPPQLGIFHLLLWTLFSAGYLAILRAIFAARELPAKYVLLQQTSGVMQGIIFGAVLTGVIVMAATRIRGGPPLARHPGYWLLLTAAGTSLAHLSLSLLFLVLQTFLDVGNAFLLCYCGIFVAVVIVYAFAAAACNLTRWRVLFLALAVVGLMQCLGNALFWFGSYSAGSWSRVLMSIPNCGRLLPFVCLIVASIWDLTAGQRRDWLHWTGVATYLASLGAAVLWTIWAQLL